MSQDLMTEHFSSPLHHVVSNPRTRVSTNYLSRSIMLYQSLALIMTAADSESHHYLLYIFYLTCQSIIKKLCGAAEARRAHNPEDSGSKPDKANHLIVLFFFLAFCCFAGILMMDIPHNAKNFFFSLWWSTLGVILWTLSTWEYRILLR